MARTVQCTYLKKEAEGMDFSPYPGELGLLPIMGARIMLGLDSALPPRFSTPSSRSISASASLSSWAISTSSWTTSSPLGSCSRPRLRTSAQIRSTTCWGVSGSPNAAIVRARPRGLTTSPAGLSCRQAMRTFVQSVSDPSLSVAKVHVKGGSASAMVLARAKGQPSSVEAVQLTDTKSGWRLASLASPR